MSYDANVLRRATQRLEEERRARSDRAARLRQEAYEKEPRLAQLDKKLQGTMSQLMAAALRRGESTAQAIQAIRAQNQDIQKERAVLLGAIGLPEDALDDKPACPLCGDTGWRGTEMCRCLRALCAQEQIRELSKLLDLGEQSFDTFRMDYYSTSFWPEWGTSPRVRGVSQLCPEVRPLLLQKPLPQRGPRAGQDLPVCLHRPHCVGERTFGGV